MLPTRLCHDTCAPARDPDTGVRTWCGPPCFDGPVLVATVSPLAYWSAVAGAGAGCVALCIVARRHPGPWRTVVARALGTVLLADAVSYSVGLAVAGTWSPKTSLPLALCDIGVLVAAVACWWETALLVELTYFWGLAGTLQGILTPDLNVGFPHLVFFQYVVGHVGIVAAALFLVVGSGIVPRRRAAPRVLAITLAYSAVVGIVDAVTGANYMFLRAPPGEWTLLPRPGPLALVHSQRSGGGGHSRDVARHPVLGGPSKGDRGHRSPRSARGPLPALARRGAALPQRCGPLACPGEGSVVTRPPDPGAWPRAGLARRLRPKGKVP